MNNSFKILSAMALALMIASPTLVMAGSGHNTVNKSIRIDDNADVGNLNSVNGSVKIGRDALVESVDTVNGAINIAEGVAVDDSIESVNGAISIDAGSDVGGNVETVNGGIRVINTRVAGNIETVNGQIRLLDSSEVTGSVVVRKPNGWSFNKRNKPVRVEIGENVIVHGDLIFEHAVELTLHETARTGEIIGEEVEVISNY